MAALVIALVSGNFYGGVDCGGHNQLVLPRSSHGVAQIERKGEPLHYVHHSPVLLYTVRVFHRRLPGVDAWDSGLRVVQDRLA